MVGAPLEEPHCHPWDASGHWVIITQAPKAELWGMSFPFCWTSSGHRCSLMSGRARLKGAMGCVLHHLCPVASEQLGQPLGGPPGLCKRLFCMLSVIQIPLGFS